MKSEVIERWHEMIDLQNFDGFNTLLADDVLLYSPAKNTPIVGKGDVLSLLYCVQKVLVNANFRYVNKWYSPNSAVLEFVTVCDEISINGVDVVTWNKNNQITQIKVMIRPFKALQKVIELMSQEMQRNQ